jgi:uncharacterized protein
MDRDKIIQVTADYVRDRLSGEATGHDWWHIERVRVLARRLAREEGADLFVVELAALLHDIADWKFHDGDLQAGARQAADWLDSCGVDCAVIDQVSEIVRTLSFKGAEVPTPMATLEGKVVQDADRLDALGAIGIARAFAYGGYRQHEIHDPGRAPEEHDSFESYRDGDNTTINHFYEKLLLLQERMNTSAARRLAAGRHSYMKTFLDRFHKEWEGDS